MPRTPSSSADRPKWLRFEAGDEESHELFAPGANWRKQDQYPALKPLDSYTRNDYLRLAWELLRRMPRYRRQYRKLDQLGIKSPSFFKSSPKHYYTSDSPPAFPGWATCPLRGHQCEPPIAGQDETFGSYLAAQEKAGQPWFVMNRYRWVMDLWGITYVPNPATHFDHLRKSGLFGAPAAAVSVISNEAPADRPQNISTYLRANEVLVRLRLDSSFDQQVESIRHEFERAQAIARKRPQRALDPLPAPGRKLMGKAVLRDEDFAGDFSPRAAAKVGRVLLKHVELHPFWLRTWDALADARKTQGTLTPRLDREMIVRQFHADYGHLDHPTGGAAGKAAQRRRKNTDLIDLIGAAIGSSAMVPNWRARSEKYIEESDDAFLFASNAGAEIFGFTGYVLLPQSILGKACSFIDRGMRASSASESFETRVAWLKDLAEREVAMHPNRRIEDFTIFYGQRSGMGMPPNSTFHLHVISWDSKARVLRTWPVVLPSRSGVLKTHGTGKAGVDKWSDAWTLSDQGNTSRTMFSAFCDSLQAKEDPMSGGEPQLVGLYRQGPGQVFGVVTERGPSLHGSLLLDVPPGVKIEWRDQLFQRVSANGELLKHAQPHSRPAQVGAPS